MAHEYCPRCRALRAARVEVVRRSATGPDGKARRLRTTSYHCETCHQFIRSEDLEEPAAAA